MSFDEPVDDVAESEIGEAFADVMANDVVADRAYDHARALHLDMENRLMATVIALSHVHRELLARIQVLESSCERSIERVERMKAIWCDDGPGIATSSKPDENSEPRISRCDSRTFRNDRCQLPRQHTGPCEFLGTPDDDVDPALARAQYQEGLVRAEQQRKENPHATTINTGIPTPEETALMKESQAYVRGFRRGQKKESSE